ncbi:MAG: S-layer protein, partial [Planctomycetota bacterium]
MALVKHNLILRHKLCKLWFSVVVVLILFGSAAFGEEDRAVSFVNDVMPVLTKAGCNAGVCHAKAGGGQNGFQLSLLGFEFQEDYEHLVKEGRGRRLFPAAPERSLLLMKAVGTMPHGGGVRLQRDSEGYELILNWIRQGAAYDEASALQLTSIEVHPKRGTVMRNAAQQLKAVAKYADGSERDVTRFALFESNDKSMADVAAGGLVQISDIPGKVAIMVRYQGRVAVFNASVPLGAPVDSVPASKNFVDDFVFANLREIGVPPSPVCDDATFLRRVSLDISGR